MIPLAPILTFARAVPWYIWVIGAAVAWGGYHRYQSMGAKKEFQEAQQEAARQFAEQKDKDNRETLRRTKTQVEILDAEKIKSDQHRASADRLRRAGEQLRAQLAAAEADRRSGDPAPAQGSEATPTATGVLTGLLGQCSQRVEVLAAYADQARRAGQTCEQAYDSLTQPTKEPR